MKLPSPRSQIIQTASIDWQNSTPVSHQFGDVYFSRDNGEAETRYVFLQHNYLEQRWQNPDLSGFTIAETGFGTGLNFFCAADLWQQKKQKGQLSPQAHLHFLSVEKFPLCREDLAHACNLHPNLNWLTEALLQQYPAPVKGIHRLYFHSANITLTLIFGDAITGFQSLDGTVDAWFLDGFAPAKNPDMWQPELFEHIGRLSHKHTTLATFTAAGIVKRGLQTAGFQLEKVAGFGRKREMLRGRFSSSAGNGNEGQAAGLPHTQKPWFHYDYRNAIRPGSGRKAVRKAAVIGAGMAGATVANSLARRGWQVRVFEKETQIATQGSGNPSGITFTKLSLHDIPQNRYYQSAYLYACRYLASALHYSGIEAGKDWQFNGVLRLAYNPAESREQNELLQERYWPEELLRGLTPAQIKDLTGISTHLSGILLSGGGWLNPGMLCQALLQHPAISVHNQHNVEQLIREDDHWFLDDDGPFDAVILANAFGASQFQQTRYLPLKPVRGQISYLPQTEASTSLQHAVNYEGYINPARDGYHCIGATFTPKITTPQHRVEDHQWNCDQLLQTLPDLASSLGLPKADPLQGRVGFRCQTPDYLPVIGPIPDIAQYQAHYRDLSKGFLKRPFPLGIYQPGLFVSAGHGSRGITSTCYGAEILASYLNGEPQIADREVLFAIHPARFLIRNIIRRQETKTQEPL